MRPLSFAPWPAGNETVPTVVIDGRPLVNPAPRQVIAAVRPG